MTNAPKIITRKKTARNKLEDFTFTRNMIPEIEDEGLRKYRQAAWKAYESLPFPTLQDEPWRRTDIRGLDTKAFSLPNRSEESGPPPKRYVESVVAIFTDFLTAEKQHPELLHGMLGKIVSADEDKFTALAAALALDGTFLYVPKNVLIEQPLHSLYWGAGEEKAFFNHILVWIDDGAQATFVHESASPHEDKKSQSFHDGIVEIYVGQNARLNFVELQSWGKNIWSFSRERARVMGNGHLEWIFGANQWQSTSRP